jgi:hypothetical protein
LTRQERPQQRPRGLDALAVSRVAAADPLLDEATIIGDSVEDVSFDCAGFDEMGAARGSGSALP